MKAGDACTPLTFPQFEILDTTDRRLASSRPDMGTSRPAVVHRPVAVLHAELLGLLDVRVPLGKTTAAIAASVRPERAALDCDIPACLTPARRNTPPHAYPAERRECNPPAPFAPTTNKQRAHRATDVGTLRNACQSLNRERFSDWRVSPATGAARG